MNIKKPGSLALSVLLAVVCATMPLHAQDRPVNLDQGVGDLTGEDEFPLQITGFGVGDFSYHPRSGENTARAGKLAVSFFREISDKFWFFGQLTTALSSGEEGGEGAEIGDEVPTEIEIDNMLVNFTPGGTSGFSVAFGKFDVPVGFERDDEPLNFQATESFNFELARPAKMVGFVGRWVATPSIDLTAMVGNGWDAQLDENTQKTTGARLGLLPSEHTSIGLSGLIGSEGESDEVHTRYLMSLDYASEPGSGWIIAGEANLGGERDALGDGNDASWYGGTLSLFHQISQHVGATIRGETFRDADGFRTGEAQTLQSLTFSPIYFVGTGREGIFANVEHTTFRIPRFQIRAEARLDHSSESIFGEDGEARDWQMRYVLQFVTTF